jgi:hypothetical protein
VPVATELFGDDHGKRGPNALAHLGVAAPNFDDAISGNLEPGVGRERTGVRQDVRSPRRTARKVEGKDQATSRCSRGGEE